jgi:Holliday junction resolvase RusA-like endonuclease
MIILLDKPPSVNSLFPTKGDGGRGKSAEYSAWRKRQGANIMAQRLKPLHGKVRLAILIDEKSRLDLDNHLKPLIDCAVHFLLIDGDGPAVVREIKIGYGVIPDLLGVTMGASITVTPHP